MPAPEDLINIATRHQVMLERLKVGYYQQFNAALDSVDKATREALMSLDVEKISRLPKRDLEQLIRDLKNITAVLLGAEVETFVLSLADLSASEAAFELASIREVVANITLTAPPAGSAFTYANNLPIRATGTLPKKFFKTLTDTETDALERVVRKGWSDGATIQQMSQRISGTRAANYADGFLRQAQKRTNIQVRTAVQHYSSASREKVWVDNADIVEGYRWVSTLDGRTSTQCQGLDGQEFPVGEGPRPPIHYGCRSATVPVLDSSLDFLDEGATRAAKGGPVDADQTYYSWLKDQPPKFQNEAIGAKRAKLLRDGGLSAEKFAALNLGKNFQPLNLREMEKLAPIAFEKAGVEV